MSFVSWSFINPYCQLHVSQGEGEERFVKVTKVPVKPPVVTSNGESSLAAPVIGNSFSALSTTTPEVATPVSGGNSLMARLSRERMARNAPSVDIASVASPGVHYPSTLLSSFLRVNGVHNKNFIFFAH